MKLRTDPQATGQRTPESQAIERADSAKLAGWHAVCGDLIVGVCMGGRFYADMRFSQGPDWTAEAYVSEVRGIKVRVQPTRYSTDERTRDAWAARADQARAYLAQATGIPAGKWVALADFVANDKGLRSYLTAQGLLPEKPSPTVENRQRRSMAESEAAADQLADALVGPRC